MFPYVEPFTLNNLIQLDYGIERRIHGKTDGKMKVQNKQNIVSFLKELIKKS